MLKVVLFVAFFCAVNAHVTVNVFNDEDPQVELKSCSPLNCDQTCRRLGFPGGVCVNGKCKCDIIKSAEDPQAELKSCSPLNCDQTCRRLGFPGGVCVNGKCKCDIIKSAEDAVVEVKSCSPIACAQNCRRIGFPGGTCVNGKCKCDIIKSADITSNEIPTADNDPQAEEDPAVEVKSCSPIACAQNCRRIGFPGGTCVNGKCKCDIIKSADNIKTSDLAFSCNGLSCFRFCTSMGFLGGNCVGDQCMCHGKKDITSNEIPTADDDPQAEVAESPLPLDASQQMSVKKPKCVFKYCLQACVLYGYISGYCDANDTCKCVK